MALLPPAADAHDHMVQGSKGTGIVKTTRIITLYLQYKNHA